MYAVTPIPILKYACLVKDLAILGRHYLFLNKAVVMYYELVDDRRDWSMLSDTVTKHL